MHYFVNLKELGTIIRVPSWFDIFKNVISNKYLVSVKNVFHSITSNVIAEGQRAACSNEGETVRLQDARLEQDWNICFRCICKVCFHNLINILINYANPTFVKEVQASD